jgi:hypothetical protein
MALDLPSWARALQAASMLAERLGARHRTLASRWTPLSLTYLRLLREAREGPSAPAGGLGLRLPGRLRFGARPRLRPVVLQPLLSPWGSSEGTERSHGSAENPGSSWPLRATGPRPSWLWISRKPLARRPRSASGLEPQTRSPPGPPVPRSRPGHDPHGAVAGEGASLDLSLNAAARRGVQNGPSSFSFSRSMGSASRLRLVTKRPVGSSRGPAEANPRLRVGAGRLAASTARESSSASASGLLRRPLEPGAFPESSSPVRSPGGALGLSEASPSSWRSAGMAPRLRLAGARPDGGFSGPEARLRRRIGGRSGASLGQGQGASDERPPLVLQPLPRRSGSESPTNVPEPRRLEPSAWRAREEPRGPSLQHRQERPVPGGEERPVADPSGSAPSPIGRQPAVERPPRPMDISRLSRSQVRRLGDRVAQHLASRQRGRAPGER